MQAARRDSHPGWRSEEGYVMVTLLAVKVATIRLSIDMMGNHLLEKSQEERDQLQVLAVG